MKFRNKSTFQAQLREKFPSQEGGWFYNCLNEVFKSESYNISARAKLETLISKTLKIPAVLGSEYPLIAFPDNCAGWRGIPRRRRHSPIEILNPLELSQLLRKHIYFRESQQRRFEDNYHITDRSFRWIAVFCHHDDWHFFAPTKSIEKVRAALKQGASPLRVCQGRNPGRKVRP